MTGTCEVEKGRRTEGPLLLAGQTVQLSRMQVAQHTAGSPEDERKLTPPRMNTVGSTSCCAPSSGAVSSLPRHARGGLAQLCF